MAIEIVGEVLAQEKIANARWARTFVDKELARLREHKAKGRRQAYYTNRDQVVGMIAICQEMGMMSTRVVNNYNKKLKRIQNLLWS